MNRERARELLPIIQAFAEGKTIQFRNSKDSKWADVEDASWFNGTEYRVRPEPMEIWVNIRRDGEIFPYLNERDAKVIVKVYGEQEYKQVAKHFREVTE